MITMLEIFFENIPSFIFEPVAIVGWLGLATALLMYRKQATVFYLTVIFSLSFMIFWRVAIQIITSRYAAILLFPFIIAAAYFIFQTENVRKIFPHLPEKYCKYLPGILLLILAVICILKCVNYNTYSPITDASAVVKNDKIAGKRIIYTFDKARGRQIQYYSGLEVKELLLAHGDWTIADLRNLIEDSRAGEWQAVYFFVADSAKKTPVTAAEVGVEDSSWRLITEQYYNKKKKKVLRVYRYTGSGISGCR